MKTELKWIVSAAGVALGALVLAVPLLLPDANQVKPTLQAGTARSMTGPGDSVQMSTTLPVPGLEAALAETDPQRQQALLDQWAQSIDVKAAADMLIRLESIQDAKFRTAAQASLLTSWSKRDLGGAATWFDDSTSADQLHQQARDVLAQVMATREPAAMVSWMQQSLSESSQRELYGPAFREWARANPADTAAFLGQMISTSATANFPWADLLGQVSAQWANTDVKGAVAWVQALPEGPAKTSALAQVGDRWAITDPSSAAAYAAQHPSPALIRNVASHWSEMDPRAAMTWAAGLPVGENQDGALETVTSMWAQKDPAAAATYANSLSPGHQKDVATVAVVSSWSTTDPARAAQWVGNITEGTVREQALQELVTTWASDNMNQAAQWLKGLPPTASRDVAITTFSSTVSSSAPVSAFQWAENISDQTARAQQLQSVAVAWMQKDPDAARTAISQSDLPQALKLDLLANAAAIRR